MYECPNGCESQRFVQKVEQPKQVKVNAQGETIACDKVGEPSVSNPRCEECGAEVEA